MRLEQHPTVRGLRGRERPAGPPATLDADELRALCTELGADDAACVEVDRPELAEESRHVLEALPGARTLLAFVCRTNPDALRSPPRSVANLEFHEGNDRVTEVGRRIVDALRQRGVRAVLPAPAFPMEMDRFPGRLWVVSHKTVAVAAGLGRMGIHRNVIHPKFGNFVTLGTVILDAEVTEYGRPLDWNPCLECKLCVAACPVGAISEDGRFDFSACYTHNYREFMSGFTAWTEQVADAGSARRLRGRVSDSEQASMWQSLSFGANYKAAYCMAVCPAGEDVIGPFLDDRGAFVRQVVKPLQRKTEPVYVLPGSDAEAHVARRFPNKQARVVDSALRPTSVDSFLQSMHLTFQRGRAADLDACFHFTFTGEVERRATVRVRGGALTVQQGHVGRADVRVTADSGTWIGYLRGERSMLWAVLARKVKVQGPLRLLRAFDRCFARG